MFRKKMLISFTLLAAMAVPVVSQAESRNDHDRDRDHRTYERDRRDNDRFDAREQYAYQRWAKENHGRYTDYNRLSSRDQQRYWGWRHDHRDVR
jgi:hypothetical protein